jgi:hypothetical protein
MNKSESITSVKRAEKTRLTARESALVEEAKADPITGYTYTIPAAALARCYVCQTVIAEVILDRGGYPVDVDVEIEQGEPRAVLTSPHRCTELSGDAQ